MRPVLLALVCPVMLIGGQQNYRLAAEAGHATSTMNDSDGRSGAVQMSHQDVAKSRGRGLWHGSRVEPVQAVTVIVLLALALMYACSYRTPSDWRECAKVKWHEWELSIIVGVWFASSVLTEVSDSIVMRQYQAPLTLALWKFVISIPCGTAAILVAGRPLPSLPAHMLGGIIKRALPLAIMIVAAKLFTYVSYGHVPLSTAQVAKAATPVATVLMARTILGQQFEWQSYLSLVPIVCGVCLGVGVGLEDFSLLGVAAALASCLVAAGQAIYMKTIFIAEEEAKTQVLPPLTLNLVVACGCVAMLLPVWLGVQIGVLPSTLDGGTLQRQVSGARTSGLVAFFIGGLTQYVQSACAYLFLEKVSPATSAVVGTARKPFIVVVSVVAFSVPVSLLNVCGIVLTFGGVAWYNCVTEVRCYIISCYSYSHNTAYDEREAIMSSTYGKAGDDACTSHTHSASCVADFAAWYEMHLTRRPLLVKAISGGTLYCIGDLLAQIVVAWHMHQLQSRQFEHARFFRALVYGGILYPPLAHAHYNFLEWLVATQMRLSGVKLTVVKTLLEQFVYWSYASNAYYHVAMGALQGLTLLECFNGLAANFWSTMLAQWALWVPVQLISFRYVPVRHQLGVVLICSLLWSTFLAAAYPPSSPSRREARY